MSEKNLTLSVVMPVYNEERTLKTIIDRVLAQPFDLEIIAVDDCSSDRSVAILTEISENHPNVRLIQHAVNQGKGAALRTGIAHCSGRFVIIQDADLEYDPDEYAILLGPLQKDLADVVYGSRFITTKPRRVLYYWHRVANHILTTLCNMVSNINLTDMETCYKVFRREIIQSIKIEESRFGFEPEVTIKVTRMGCRIYEVGISYAGRTYEEGKKIGFKDGLRALWCIGKYGLLVKRSATPYGQ